MKKFRDTYHRNQHLRPDNQPTNLQGGVKQRTYLGAIQRTGSLQRPEHTWARPPSQLALAFLGLGQQDSPLHWLSLGLSLRFLRSSIVCARSCLPSATSSWSAWGLGHRGARVLFLVVVRHEVAADHLRAVPTLHGAAGRGRRERRLLGARGAAQALGALLRRPGGEHALQEGCPAAAAAWLSRLRALLRRAPRRPLINTCTKNFFACGAWRQPTNL